MTSATTTTTAPTGRLAQLIEALTWTPQTREQLVTATGIPDAQIHVYLRRAREGGHARQDAAGWVTTRPKSAPAPTPAKAPGARAKATRTAPARAAADEPPRLPSTRAQALIEAADTARSAYELADLAGVPRPQVVVYLQRAVEAGWLERGEDTDPPTYTSTEYGRLTAAAAKGLAARP